MSEKNKRVTKVKRYDPFQDSKPFKSKMTAEEVAEINLELRQMNVEINRIEYETEKSLKDILIDGFVV